MVLTTASGSPSWIDSFPTGGRLTAILGSAEGASIFARDLPVFGRRKSRGLASWVVLLIAPLALLSAIVGVRLSNGDNNIFTQVAFVVLVGLAAKNAILIVEFAYEEERRGRDPLAAVHEAARLRLRPILMTSLAFIAGVVPLVVAAGAGAEMRHAMGIAVFAGMLGVTFFGLILTPVFYVVIRRLVLRRAAGRGVSAMAAVEGDPLR